MLFIFDNSRACFSEGMIIIISEIKKKELDKFMIRFIEPGTSVDNYFYFNKWKVI